MSAMFHEFALAHPALTFFGLAIPAAFAIYYGALLCVGFSMSGYLGEVLGSMLANDKDSEQ